MNQFSTATAGGSINYKAIIDNAVMAILLCKPDGSILSANKAGCELFGYDETELKEKGRNGVIDLTPGLVEYINERIIKGSVKGEITGIKKDQERIPLEFTSTIYHDDNGEVLTCNTLVDISERKKALEELHQRQQLLEQAEASYQEIFNKTDNGIGIHELDSWKVIDVNLQACEIMVCSKEALIGIDPLNLFELIPGQQNETGLEKFRKAAAGEPQQFEWLTKDFTGNMLWAEVSLKRTTIAGVDRILSFIRRVNDRKSAEKQKNIEQVNKDALINSTSDLMWSVDRNIRLIAANNAVIHFHQKLSGITLTPGALVLAKDILSNELIDFWQELYNRAFNGETFTTKIQGPPAESEYEWLDVGFNPIFRKQEVVAVACYARNITESQRAAENLKQTILRYTNVTKATSDAIWDWDMKSNIVHLGETYHHLFGTQKDEATTSVEKVISRLHPEEKASLLKTAGEAIKNGSLNWTNEHRFLKADDSFAFVSNKALIIRNEAGRATRVIGAMQDITRQKQEQQHLKLLESAILNTNDSVVITEAEPLDNPGPKIIYVNEAFTKMTGYLPEEVIGKTPRILQGPESDKEDLSRLGRGLREWKTCEITTLNYKKNGEPFWNNMSISPVADENGWFTHWIAIERDVTEQKLLEIKLQELNASLQQQAKELALSNTDLEQFAYIASHDLQEPLRMVSSFLNLLQDRYGDALDEKGKSYIHFAVDGAKRMRQLIMDLLEFSKVGKMNELPERIDPAVLIENIEMLFMKKITETNATINVSPLPEILSHKTPLQQIFQNIIGNALKYSARGRAVTIDISCLDTPTHWQFNIKDTGIGVDPIYFEKIFVIFQRLHNKDQYSGTGMGLAITKKIVENLGGSIWLESEPDKGSTFHFTIAKPVAGKLA